jgi:hypothetical protein
MSPYVTPHSSQKQIAHTRNQEPQQPESLAPPAVPQADLMDADERDAAPVSLPVQPGDLELPNDEELRTLRRVSDKIPFKAYTIAFVELVERMSYYGTTQVSPHHCHRTLLVSTNG